VVLPDNIGELLRSVFAGQNLIAHRQKLRLYGAGLWKSRHAVEDKFTTENIESTAKIINAISSIQVDGSVSCGSQDSGNRRVAARADPSCAPPC